MRAFRVFVAAIIMLLSMGVLGGSAAADSGESKVRPKDGNGCALVAPNEILCVEAHGSGTFVSDAYGITDLSIPWVCDRDFKIWGTLADGAPFEQTGTAGCGAFRVTKKFVINKHLANNSDLCVVGKHHSTPIWSTVKACVRIYA